MVLHLKFPGKEADWPAEGALYPLSVTRQAGAHHADPAVEACSCDPEDGEKNGVLKERGKGMVIRCRRSKGHLLSALSAKVSFGFIQ